MGRYKTKNLVTLPKPPKKSDDKNVINAEFVLHRIQHNFTSCTKIYRSFCAGISSGKTKVGAYDLCARSKPGRTYMIVAPDFRMLDRATTPTFMEMAKALSLWDDRTYSRTAGKVVLRNNALIWFGSGEDPNRLRGPNLSGAWLDEAGLMQEEVYNVMIGRLRECGESGWLSATYTPQAPDHWTVERFEKSDDPNIGCFRCKTCDNPFNPPTFYDDLKRQYGELRARRELDGETLYLEGAEWPPEWFKDDIWVDEFPSPDKGVKVAALDSSKGRGGKTGDYSAFTEVQWHDGLLYVDADMDNTRDSSAIAHTAVEIQAKWNPVVLGLEEEFGGSVLMDNIHRIADDRKLMMPVVLLGTDQIPKEVRIRRLTPYLCDKRFRFKSRSKGAELLVNQLKAFPVAAHEDGPDSLEMSIRLLNLMLSGQMLPPAVRP